MAKFTQEKEKQNAIIADKVKNLIQRGYKRKEVCKELGITNDKLRLLGYRYGFNFMHNAGQKPAHDWKREANNIMAMLDAGKTRYEIADFYNVSHSHICKIIRQNCSVEYWGPSFWSQEELSALEKLYKSGEYRHNFDKSTDRKTGVYYAFQRYINKTRSKAAVNPVSGEDVHCAVYTNEFVDMIRDELWTGKYNSIREIAEAHNMPYTSAYNILTYRSFTRHLKIDEKQIEEMRRKMREVCKKRLRGEI